MARAARKTNRAAEGRAARIPLGQRVAKMALPERRGYEQRWVNDVGGRLQAAEAAGWQHLKDETMTDAEGRAGYRSMTVGVKEDGTPLTAYAMEVPKKLYDQDQRAKQADVDAVDEAIRAGAISGEPGADGRYIPKTGITMRRN